MSWNYRVIRHHDPMPAGGTEERLTIHEVYYEKGKVTLWAEAPTHPLGSGAGALLELHEDFELMIEALGKPILNAADLPR